MNYPFFYEPPHDKTNKMTCAQRRFRSAWASAHLASLPPSLISLRCLHEEALGHWLPIIRTAKTLIRLGGCPGWSESLLGAQVVLLVLSCGGSIIISKYTRAIVLEFGVQYTVSFTNVVPGNMDGWVRVLRPFNSISVITRRWKGEHEMLCAMKRRLGSGRISPPAGFEPVIRSRER